MNVDTESVVYSRLEKTANALRANNMEVFIVENRQKAMEKTEELLSEGDRIGLGGSVTLNECKITDLVRSKKYRFIDRYEAGLTAEQIRERHIEALSADVYITSSNAVTENGELYNVDGNGNRIAAIAYGPGKVIVVAGYNKITPDLKEAIMRVKRIAAPANVKRLKIDGYCSKTGECISCKTENSEMSDGCSGQGRICCDYLISGYQREKNRIKVILVAEKLGY